MQIGKTYPATIARVMLLGSTLLFGGCAKPYFVSAAPDGSQLTLWETSHGSDASVRITISENGRANLVYDNVEDRSTYPVHVAWTQDSQRVFVLVCNHWGSNILVGYDRPSHQNIDHAQVEQELRQSIASTYNPSSESLKKHQNNAIDWLCREDPARN